MATLRTPAGTIPLAAVATDLDRTLTDPQLDPVPEALAALAALRKEGVRTVLCTGRAQAELPPAVVSGIFDGLVLEGGAVAGLPGDLKAFPAPKGWPAGVQGWLKANDIPYIQGESFLSILADHVGDAQRLAREIPITYHLNRDRVDITPPGVDKGSGLHHVLRLLGTQGNVLAFGDNHNDIPLLQAATFGVAVENAVEDLKAVAHEVAGNYGGFGVAAFLQERVGRAAPSVPAPRGRTGKVAGPTA